MTISDHNIPPSGVNKPENQGARPASAPQGGASSANSPKNNSNGHAQGDNFSSDFVFGTSSFPMSGSTDAPKPKEPEVEILAPEDLEPEKPQAEPYNPEEHETHDIASYKFDEDNIVYADQSHRQAAKEAGGKKAEKQRDKNVKDEDRFGKSSQKEKTVKASEMMNKNRNQVSTDVQDSSRPLRIGEKLVQKGLISPDQLEIALKTQRSLHSSQSKMLGSILVEMGFITESALGEVLAESTGVIKFDPKSTVLDSNLIRQVPKETCLRHKVVPVLLDGESIYLAMVDIYNVLAIDQIQRIFPKNYKIVPVYCGESQILEIIDQYYDYEMSVDGILREIETGERDPKALASGDAYINPTVRLVDSILADAVKRGASDLHFEPEDNFLRLRYRIDGKLQQIRSFHKDYWPSIAVRIKIISGMNIAETRLPQDGRITMNVLGRNVDFRVASQPTIHGENFVLRILDRKADTVELNKLGFNAEKERLLKNLIKRPEGVVVITGPTGSGKTTTLYSILHHLNTIDVNIMTLENPVEFQMSMVRQSQINPNYGMDFGSGIKSIMRQDPDIILVGEVRDEESAQMALRAAMTGHQVYTTLHTNDALGAIPRLIDIGIKPAMLSGALICCMAQRLGRRLCDCAETREASEYESRILGVDPHNAPQLRYPVGCERCNNTGYKGRVAIVELLPIDRELDDMIAKNMSRKDMMDYALSQGFTPMMEDGIAKVLQGTTSLEELIETIDLTDRIIAVEKELGMK